MNSFLFRLQPDSDPDIAEEELLLLGLLHPYRIEDDATGEILLGGLAPSSLPTERLIHSVLAQKSPSAPIDWHEQWAQFAEDFREGIAHIDLSTFGVEKTLQLAPGPGFGDLSHPTTYLVLSLMSRYVSGNPVLDIGCGSGILSLAALHLGASSAFGIDIDPQAISHAAKNAKLNHLQAHFGRTVPSNYPKSIALMNMILSEQKQVISAHTFAAKLWITSGILEEQKAEYLALTEQWGWRLREAVQKGDWCGFVFQPA